MIFRLSPLTSFRDGAGDDGLACCKFDVSSENTNDDVHIWLRHRGAERDLYTPLSGTKREEWKFVNPGIEKVKSFVSGTFVCFIKEVTLIWVLEHSFIIYHWHVYITYVCNCFVVTYISVIVRVQMWDRLLPIIYHSSCFSPVPRNVRTLLCLACFWFWPVSV